MRSRLNQVPRAFHRRPTPSSLALSLLVGMTFCSTSCHFDDARARCSELSETLYAARKERDPARVRSVLTSSFLAEGDRDALVSQVLDHDASVGPQESRVEYLRVAKRTGDFPDKWYSVRNRYRITYPLGETWEEVTCRIDNSGRDGAIVGLEFGPSPGK